MYGAGPYLSVASHLMGDSRVDDWCDTLFHHQSGINPKACSLEVPVWYDKVGIPVNGDLRHLRAGTKRVLVPAGSHESGNGRSRDHGHAAYAEGLCDLDISVIDELPAGRQTIKNCVVDPGYRPKAYAFIERQVAEGHQAYVICPMVEEGEMDGLENVLDYAEKLKLVFPDTIRIAALHGKMKPAEKNSIMDAFARKDIDILVSTTVIEVGINVPNATVMMVENAERCGLAQLHQLRGRVGRGDAQSYCIFISGNDNEQTMKRLKILNSSNDGFHIANEDLKLRGPGDLFGIRQSGLLDFKIGDIYQDSDLLLSASSLADRIAAEDPEENDSRYSLLYEKEKENWNSIDFRSI